MCVKRRRHSTRSAKKRKEKSKHGEQRVCQERNGVSRQELQGVKENMKEE